MMHGTDDTAFWKLLDRMVLEHEICIDRPKGSVHPRFHDFIYPLDYGYLEGTASSDGQGMDVWRGSLAEPKPTALICCIDAMKGDSEIKILCGCTAEEIEDVYRIHNRFPLMKGILMMRPEGV